MMCQKATRKLGLIEDTRKLLEKLQSDGEEVNVPSETLVVDKEEVAVWFLGYIYSMPYYVACSLDQYGHPVFITRWTWRRPQVQRVHHSKIEHVNARILHLMVQNLLPKSEEKTDETSEKSAATAS